MLSKYLKKNYNKIKSIAYNITSGKGDDDLLSFTIEELYKCDQKRINVIIKKKQMTFYIARIMVNQLHSKTSRYYYKYKKYYEYHTGSLGEGTCPDDSQKQIENKEIIEKQLGWIDEKLKDLYWFDSQVFKIYFSEEHSLNTMSRATKISRNTLFKSISNVKKHLKNEK